MDAEIDVVLTTEAISPGSIPTRNDCGAVIEFLGVVRGEEGGGTIDGLHYQAYQPMAENQMRDIICELLRDFPCRLVGVTHRLGFVPVGETSIAIRLAAPHRQEAISFLAEFMNRLKKDVPIWKSTSPLNGPKS
jgi:molybdopterin synthase catalytic subunit